MSAFQIYAPDHRSLTLRNRDDLDAGSADRQSHNNCSCPYDSVTVYDGDSTSSPIIKKVVLNRNVFHNRLKTSLNIKIRSTSDGHLYKTNNN